MKKTLLAIALIMIIATGAVFAADPAVASFEVKTEVTSINEMKITVADLTDATLSDFRDAAPYTGPFVVGSENYGTKQTVAYLSTLSNNRTGYIVELSATAMKSAGTSPTYDAYINYTVECGDASVITNNDAVVKDVEKQVVDIDKLTGIGATSTLITITVNTVDYESAVSGTYSGNVYFTYTAN